MTSSSPTRFSYNPQDEVVMATGSLPLAIGPDEVATAKVKLNDLEQVGQRGGEQRLKASLARLIRAGEIKYSEPHEAVCRFKPDGSPYTGVARWHDGRLTLERVTITDCWR